MTFLTWLGLGYDLFNLAKCSCLFLKEHVHSLCVPFSDAYIRGVRHTMSCADHLFYEVIHAGGQRQNVL